MSSAQVQQLKAAWPLTTAALAETYLARIYLAVTDSAGHNEAGHVLFYLARAHEHALKCHGPERAAAGVADELFAREVRYLAGRGFKPRHIVATLGTCWYNLVHERGERWRPKAVPTPVPGAPRFPRQANNSVTMGQVLARMEVARA